MYTTSDEKQCEGRFSLYNLYLKYLLGSLGKDFSNKLKQRKPAIAKKLPGKCMIWSRSNNFFWE